MKGTIWEQLPNLDKHCFGCGVENTIGLKMTFEANQEAVRSKVVVPGQMRGWNNIVHGGILSTICDEIMSWAAIRLTKKFVFTKKLTISFIKPVISAHPQIVDFRVHQEVKNYSRSSSQSNFVLHRIKLQKIFNTGIIKAHLYRLKLKQARYCSRHVAGLALALAMVSKLAATMDDQT